MSQRNVCAPANFTCVRNGVDHEQYASFVSAVVAVPPFAKIPGLSTTLQFEYAVVPVLTPPDMKVFEPNRAVSATSTPFHTSVRCRAASLIVTTLFVVRVAAAGVRSYRPHTCAPGLGRRESFG